MTEYPYIAIMRLHPLQPDFGEAEVLSKTKKILTLKKEGKANLTSYLVRKRPLVIIAPDGTHYMEDGHHTARAALEAGIEEVPYEVGEDWRGKLVKEPMAARMQAFFESLKADKKILLLNQAGETIRPEDLPKTVRGLKNDPFRSLAWFVREAGGFDNLDIPFQEFAWAHFFRKKIYLPKDPSDHDLHAAFDLAFALSHSESAKKLPGYISGRKVDLPACEELRKDWIKYSLDIQE